MGWIERAETGRRSAALTALAVCLFGLSLPSSQGAPKSTLKLGVVVDQKDFQDGGCGLLLASDSSYACERYVFMSDYNGRAVMNINGLDTRFTLIRSNESRGRIKKGDRSSYWYASGSIVVEVDYTVTDVCPPDDESCEVFYYQAMIHVTSGRLKQSIAAHGLCGT
jgi:hypothetical protein